MTDRSPCGAVPEMSEWLAQLDLAYERRDGRTVPSLRRHFGPLRIQKHFEPEPGLCEHVIVHPPAGIAGGDRLEINVLVNDGAAVRLTTPGATRWYRSSGPRASAHLHATLAEGAFLEWLPQEQIVFDRANALSSLRFDLHPTATLIAWDVVALGRRAGDQPFAEGTWRSRLDVSIGDRLVLAERASLDAADPLRPSNLGWSGHDVSATFFATGSKQLAAILPAARALEVPGSAGITEIVIQGTSLVIARLLTEHVAAASSWLLALWQLARPLLTDRPHQPSRIWRT